MITALNAGVFTFTSPAVPRYQLVRLGSVTGEFLSFSTLDRAVRIQAHCKLGNTRYTKTQHCFVACFGRCFAFFTWRAQLAPQQKHLLRIEEMRHADWLICYGTSKFVARQVVSLMKHEQQSQNLLLKVDPCSTFRNNLLSTRDK